MGGCCCGPTEPAPALRPQASKIIVETPDQDPNRLVTMVYMSRMVSGYFESEKAVETMVRFAGANNRSAGLSGFLLVAAPYFLQRLEGPEARLRALMGGIRRDHRHDNFIVVEETAIEERSYGSWSMRSFDLVKSSDTKFEAVSFVLQSLSKGLTVAAKNIHPPIFDAMLAGRQLALDDEVFEMVVVTISLGNVVQTSADSKVYVDPEFICQMVDLLHRRICSLNPEGRGLVSLYGGTVIQLAIRKHPDGFNLENKVVRACVELATGQGNAPTGQIRIYVSSGKVEEKYLAVGDDLRRGRFLRGEALSSGVEVARALQAKAHPVVLQDVVAKRLRDEFELQSLSGGLKAVALPQPEVAIVKPLSGPGRQVRNCESALMALMRHVGGQDKPRLLGAEDPATSKPVSACSSNTSLPGEADETDLEWMYQLDNLSQAFEKSLAKKKRKKPTKNAPGRYRRPQPVGQLERLDSRASLGLARNNLLNIIYLSRISDEHPMTSKEITEIGTKAAKANAKISVTGFLLYTKPFFLQYLEGHPAQVKDLFARIRTDPRHTGVTVIASHIINDNARNFASWNMKTADLDSETSQETGPLREVLRLLTRQFNELKLWLPRLQNDMLLSRMSFHPGAYAQCTLAAFAVHTAKADKKVTEILESLVGFLNRGGELVGFLGPHLVGYAFGANVEMVIDEVTDLCSDFKVNVGVTVGNMLLMNAGRDRDDCDIGFYGPLFERAQELADRAVKAKVPIVAEKSCEVQVASLTWQEVDGLLHGRLDS
eukprot:EG_transcript_1673